MKKLNLILCILVLFMIVFNGIFLYRNWNLYQDLSRIVETNSAKLESTLGTMHHLVNVILGKIQSLDSDNVLDNRVTGTEFKLREFNEEQVILNCYLSLSRVNKGEKVYLVLHEGGNNEYQRIELTKLEGAFYNVELFLSPEKTYKYQVVFEKDGAITSSQELRIPEQYYKPQTFRVTPRLVINSTKREKIPELEFELSLSTKAYFEEIQAKAAKIVVYEGETKVKELPFNILNADYGSHLISFKLNEGDIERYDFYLQVEYKGGLEKREKINDEKNPEWAAVLNQYEWYFKD
ncbi:hypothetical protein [Kosmotoga pacifica]|uniref:Uncharacterized protein n=1 Tax=Kosmotoga pacifica TaxID=1330330 RepID=A0A0G2Z4X1_9BACT|nr:hypothetical protein [Kosmotoga pacifica]AKI96660.1 hypothetical protein IX53_01185 [Kosmotoga pacifica]